ncbi:hypothetical protein LPMP_161330 [Leishmania panamensis]|uniref:Sm domain-containing protein n=6 Tax=Viannia TaxID=37616 RepID=A4H8R5_LEIBR|nr:conserved hypothetical protein [Leishmania braziliensis MHOM/BR/75/M2904]XP_010697661.1 hypothetical protein LPMP_161330 [Leishmania panamensis]KAI5691883.1 hypothetical protein MNV84_02276 [Leishmania braziliensis]AIN97008.1 hypothetical protein LPMP_161330 [Leishmania panamensis]CAJ2469793.1 unnamed protein product [Leishmania braziliensis]CAJ2470295.1 unnamed protein product [Leishmania braziliensis]CAM37781.1 conserved hypothetical protein [Leishmania braziliensis MHOM/BR/75/M2904]
MAANGNGHATDTGAAEGHPFLGRELRVELTDGRIIIGTLIAYEGSGDLLLQTAVEQRVFKDGEVTMRGLNLLAIPFKHVKGLHRRQPGLKPIVLTRGEVEKETPALVI